VVELDFYQIFLPYTFRLIGPQTKHSQIQPWWVKIGLRLRCWCPLFIINNELTFSYVTTKLCNEPAEKGRCWHCWQLIKIKFLTRIFLFYNHYRYLIQRYIRNGKDPDPYLWQRDPDADPEGPKTYGSYRSGTLVGMILPLCTSEPQLRIRHHIWIRNQIFWKVSIQIRTKATSATYCNIS